MPCSPQRAGGIGRVNDLPHLAELDEQLRRIGWDDEHVGVCLDKNSSLALVGLAQIFARRHGIGYTRIQVGRLGDRTQFEQVPQKSGRPSLSAWFRQFTAWASISASVYLPEPRGPARMSECGNRPARTLSRRCVTVAVLPKKF